MKIINYFLENKAFTSLLLALVLLGGVFSYQKMGKLEDAPFTIKQALVVTQYPGASPSEVQTQVTDVLEEAIQSMGELYYTKSENMAGISKIEVNVKKEIRANEMQQLWDKLRRKVSDAQVKLPPGAHTSVVKDDFGDVLGVFYGLSSSTHSYRELEDQAKVIKSKILTVPDVARVTLFGRQMPTIEILVKPSIMSSTGIRTTDIMQAIQSQNNIVSAGAIETTNNRIRLEPTGNFYNLESIKNSTIVTQKGEYFLLSDIAEVKESYRTPALSKMYINGEAAIGIAIATTPTGNVVDMAELVKEEMTKFEQELPEGYTIQAIYDQGKESAEANNGFILNLIVSVLTVIAILLLFIGFKNGFLVSSGLIFSIFGTLIVMLSTNIALQRMSLAAIIIAMGMLVDNAIVVFDSAYINMQKGMRKKEAILKAVKDTAMPLLAATIIAILTFLPIYFSPHITGELLSTLVIVIAVSLLFSWVFAMIQTPFSIQQHVKEIESNGTHNDPFGGPFYQKFRKALAFFIKHKLTTIGVIIILLITSAYSFRYVPKVFIPSLNKSYFMIDMWMPNGTKVEETEHTANLIAQRILTSKDVEVVSTYIGQSPPRYYLANKSYGPQATYANLLIKCTSGEAATQLITKYQESINKAFPHAFIKVNKFEMSSAPEALIEARFTGPDANVLDSLTQEALAIMRRNPKAKNIRNEWGNKAMLIKPEYSALKASRMHLTKNNMMQSFLAQSDGVAVGLYRDEEQKVPILLKTKTQTPLTLSEIGNLSVWNGSQSVPLSQITNSIQTTWEYPRIKTYNRHLSMAAMCDTYDEYTMAEVHSEIRDSIEALQLPEGYDFFWDSQFKNQKESLEALVKYFPLAFIFLIVILVALFGNYKDPLIILTILPLSLIGVSLGFVLTKWNFGFFPIAGWLGLLGMVIKNVIVLLDEINNLRNSGMDAYHAIIESTVSRARPVLMAALTTVFGMIPLLFDVAFNGMALTIICGLSFATLLTLFITPVLYALFYKIKSV